MKKTAVLFDLDGTLWSACATMLAPWNDTLTTFPGMERAPLTLPEMQSLMGKTLLEIARLLYPDAPADKACEVVELACENEVPVLESKGGILYDSVPDLLRGLKADHFVGIVSNCQCGYIEAFLTAHGLADAIDGFLCEGMTHLTKGQNIQKIMADNGLARAVYVGDTRGDESAARAAGVPFIHAAYGFGDAAAPDAAIHSPAELPSLLHCFF